MRASTPLTLLATLMYVRIAVGVKTSVGTLALSVAAIDAQRAFRQGYGAFGQT